MKTSAILSLAICLVITSCCGNRDREVKTDYEYTVNNSFAFNLPLKADTAETLLALIREINPNILFMRQVNLLPGEQKVPLVVSCYTEQYPMNLDTAFFVHTADFPSRGVDGFTSLPQSHSRYEKEGKTFYRKVSCMNDQVVNVMYYAMKNNRDRNMYELKMSGPVKDSTAIMDFLEGVMAGSAFVD